jgi:hypothetical protein
MSVRAGHSTLTRGADCVRTGCHEEVAYNPRSPALYCSTACRVAAARDQKWLLQEAQRLTSLIAASPEDSTDPRDRLKLVLWHLRRYAPAWAPDSGLGGADSATA